MDDVGKKWHDTAAQWQAGLVPGSQISYKRSDGTVWTDTVTAVSYKSPEWVPPVQPTGWRRILRAITPRRLRKPLPRSPSRPAVMNINVGVHAPDLDRHLKSMHDIQAMIGKFGV